MHPLLVLVFSSFLLTAMNEPKDGERVAALETILRHLHRIFLLFKFRIEDMFIKAAPLMEQLTIDVPEVSQPIHSIIDTISGVYNSDNFAYLQEDIVHMFIVFVTPVLEADDKCVKSAHNQLVTMLKPSESAFAAALRERFIKIDKLMREAVPMFNMVVELLRVYAEDAIERGKLCTNDNGPLKMIECMQDAIRPWSKEMDALPNNAVFSVFMTKMRELTAEVLSAGGNASGALESLLKDVWMSFVLCVEERHKKKRLRNRQAFPTWWNTFL